MVDDPPILDNGDVVYYLDDDRNKVYLTREEIDE